MFYLFRKLTFFKLIILIILAIIFLLNAYVNFNYSKVYNFIKKFDKNDTKFIKNIWIIMDDYSCKDLNEFIFPKNWDIFARIKNKTINCDEKRIYMDDFHILKQAINQDVDKIGVFKRIPDDFSLWTDPYTLFIHNKSTTYGKVCRRLYHSMTIETYDFPMMDWRISFYIKGRIVPFNPYVNILLEKPTLWLFPLLRDEHNIAACLEYLSSQSKIRTLDLRSKMVYPNLKNNIEKNMENKKNMRVHDFLNNLTQTEIVQSTVRELQELNYKWPILNNSDSGHFCSPVIWKDTEPLKTKDPDCHEIKVPFSGQAERIDDMLFIVVFNNPLYHVMPYVNNLYMKLFKHFAYCGPEEYPKGYKRYFVQYINKEGRRLDRSGLLNNICTSVYLSMRHKHTKGLLVIHDDLILNVHVLKQFPFNNFMIPKTDHQIKENYWKIQKETLVKSLEGVYASNDLDFRKCAKTLTKKKPIRYTLRGAFADIFYVPYIQTLTRPFIKLNDYFIDKKVSFMVAVPTIMDCLQNVVYSNTTPYPVADRNKQWQKAHDLPKKLYIHPVKWGKIKKGQKDYSLRQHLYCRSMYFINDKEVRWDTLMYIYTHRHQFPTFY